MNFFTINSDLDRLEQKGHRVKVPGSQMARERKGQGASWPGSESARVLLADSLRGVNGPGSEKTPYLREQHNLIQLNSTQRASMDAGVKTPHCPHLSSHYCISIL